MAANYRHVAVGQSLAKLAALNLKAIANYSVSVAASQVSNSPVFTAAAFGSALIILAGAGIKTPKIPISLRCLWRHLDELACRSRCSFADVPIVPHHCRPSSRVYDGH